jgi:2-C-methyl-D-erythritol 4-phosphate cytidylyltransferase
MSARALGVVPLEGRGRLPLVDLHGETLFLHAVRAMTEALGDAPVTVTVDEFQRPDVERALGRRHPDVTVMDATDWWDRVAAGSLVALHDPLCPLVPTRFLASTLDEARRASGAVVSFRPVTDTIKTVVDDQIVDTIDRDRFGIVTSPVVFRTPPHVGDRPPTHDFGRLVTWLRSRGPVELRKGPSLGRRVDDASAVNLLECMDEMAHVVLET